MVTLGIHRMNQFNETKLFKITYVPGIELPHVILFEHYGRSSVAASSGRKVRFTFDCFQVFHHIGLPVASEPTVFSSFRKHIIGRKGQIPVFPSFRGLDRIDGDHFLPLSFAFSSISSVRVNREVIAL